MNEEQGAPPASIKIYAVLILALVLILAAIALILYLQGDVDHSLVIAGMAIFISIYATVAFTMYLLLNWSSQGSFFWTAGLSLAVMAFLPIEDYPWPNRIVVFIVGFTWMVIGFLCRFHDRDLPSSGTPEKPEGRETGSEAKLHTEPYTPPSWLEQGMKATYHSEDSISHYQVVPQKDNFIIKARYVETGELAELFPEMKDSGWSEEPLSKWQEEYYGEPFIDTLRDPSFHSIFGEETEYLGTEKVRFRGEPYNCIKLGTSHVDDCHCVRMAKHLMFYRGLGSCSKCGGIFSSLRKCSECNGTGKCSSCEGKGKLRKIGYYWYEEKRGLLLRHEFYWWKKRVNVEELQSLTPNFESLNPTGSRKSASIRS